VVEAQIVWRWLAKKNVGNDNFIRFKEYGRGRLKLLKLHVEEYIDSVEDPPQELVDYAKALDAEVNEDIWEEFQDISVDKTFSGIPIRQMAIDIGMKREYDFLFAPASGGAHGDWPALDRFALCRCQNPAHMWHRMPNKNPGSIVQPYLIDSVLKIAEEMVGGYQGTFRAATLSLK
jgi:hypothetical protein